MDAGGARSAEAEAETRSRESRSPRRNCGLVEHALQLRQAAIRSARNARASEAAAARAGASDLKPRTPGGGDPVGGDDRAERGRRPWSGSAARRERRKLPSVANARGTEAEARRSEAEQAAADARRRPRRGSFPPSDASVGSRPRQDALQPVRRRRRAARLAARASGAARRILIVARGARRDLRRSYPRRSSRVAAVEAEQRARRGGVDVREGDAADANARRNSPVRPRRRRASGAERRWRSTAERRRAPSRTRLQRRRRELASSKAWLFGMPAKSRRRRRRAGALTRRGGWRMCAARSRCAKNRAPRSVRSLRDGRQGATVRDADGCRESISATCLSTRSRRHKADFEGRAEADHRAEGDNSCSRRTTCARSATCWRRWYAPRARRRRRKPKSRCPNGSAEERRSDDAIYAREMRSTNSPVVSHSVSHVRRPDGGVRLVSTRKRVRRMSPRRSTPARQTR